MRVVISNIIILLMAVTYILLAMQAEIVTAVLGYVFGGIMLLALLRNTWLQTREADDVE
jgi:hypothetical protein